MGIYCFSLAFLLEQLSSTPRDAGEPPRLRSRPPSRRVVETHGVHRLPVPRREPQSATPTGATSARSTPTSRPTWISWRSIPQLNLYDEQWPIRTLPSRLPAAEVRVRRRGARRPARRGHRQPRLPRRDPLRRPGDAVDHRARAFASTVSRGSRRASSSKGSTSAGMPGSGGRSSTRASAGAAPACRSASIPERDAARGLTVSAAGRDRGAQGIISSRIPPPACSRPFRPLIH